MKARTTWQWMAAALLLILSGCGEPRLLIVKGKLLYQGKPVPSTWVNFQPADGSRPSRGRTDDDGNFALDYSTQEKGVVRGHHTVYLMYDISGPEELGQIPPKADKKLQKLIAAKYGDPNKSPLACDVAKNGQFVELQLE